MVEKHHKQSSRRIIRLETCRGLAALIVVFTHIIVGFAPSVSGVLEGTKTSASLVGTVPFVFINGTAAVAFFFVMSGYVLTARFFEQPDHNYMMVSMLKRLPRLALLTTMATTISAILWVLHLYHFKEASEITGSTWLQDGANAVFPANFHASFPAATLQGAWLTFVSGDDYYDTSLWTMRYEFYGSMLVFTLAPFIVFILRKRMVWLFIILSIVLFRYASPFMIPFLCGMGLSYYRITFARSSNGYINALLLILGVYLLGFYYPERQYFVFSEFLPLGRGAHDDMIRLVVHTVGSMCVILAVMESKVAETLLDNAVGGWLGRLSFPVYLVHVPIILSVSSAVYLGLFPSGAAIWGAAVCTLVLTFMISWPLAWIDGIWVRFLNDRIGRLVSGPGRFAELTA